MTQEIIVGAYTAVGHGVDPISRKPAVVLSAPGYAIHFTPAEAAETIRRFQAALAFVRDWAPATEPAPAAINPAPVPVTNPVPHLHYEGRDYVEAPASLPNSCKGCAFCVGYGCNLAAQKEAKARFGGDCSDRNVIYVEVKE